MILGHYPQVQPCFWVIRSAGDPLQRPRMQPNAAIDRAEYLRNESVLDIHQRVDTMPNTTF